MKKDIITFMNNNGEITNARILYAYEKTGGKIGIVYTDDTKTESGNIKTYARVFNPKNNKLEKITKKEEWEFISKLLTSFDKKRK
jgi:uncharacterized protein YrzB (UPF0473 family)